MTTEKVLQVIVDNVCATCPGKTDDMLCAYHRERCYGLYQRTAEGVMMAIANENISEVVTLEDLTRFDEVVEDATCPFCGETIYFRIRDIPVSCECGAIIRDGEVPQ